MFCLNQPKQKRKVPSTPVYVEATLDFVETTFDFVERIVRLVAFDYVASTLLLVCVNAMILSCIEI